MFDSCILSSAAHVTLCVDVTASETSIFPLSSLSPQDLVVRLLFTLGNLTSKNDEARELLFRCEGCVDTLLLLYDSYQRRDNSHTAHTLTKEDPQTPSRPHVSPGSARGDEDVLVKLVRVLANMCVHPAVGPALASNTACTQLLMETLGEQRAAIPLTAQLYHSITKLEIESSAGFCFKHTHFCPFCG